MARLGLKGLLVLLRRLGAVRRDNGTDTMKAHNKEVSRIYEEAQLIPNEPVVTTLDDLSGLSSAWKDPGVADLQSRVSLFQVSQFEKGIVDPVFVEFIASVTQIKGEVRSLLELACGGGYYGKSLA